MTLSYRVKKVEKLEGIPSCEVEKKKNTIQ